MPVQAVGLIVEHPLNVGAQQRSASLTPLLPSATARDTQVQEDRAILALADLLTTAPAGLHMPGREGRVTTAPADLLTPVLAGLLTLVLADLPTMVLVALATMALGGLSTLVLVALAMMVLGGRATVDLGVVEMIAQRFVRPAGNIRPLPWRLSKQPTWPGGSPGCTTQGPKRIVPTSQ
jgi:hypothetical protein